MMQMIDRGLSEEQKMMRETCRAFVDDFVTPFIRQSADRFAVRAVPAPFELRRPSLRLTIDTRQDLQFVRSLVEDAGDDAAVLTLRHVIALADRSAAWAGVA